MQLTLLKNRRHDRIKLRTRCDILLMLASGSDVHSQKEIVEMLQLDKSRVAILIKRLKQKGFVYTERNHADRRIHFVFLTSNGQEILPKVQEAMDQVNMNINRQLNASLLDCFYQTFIQMQSNLVEDWNAISCRNKI